MGSVGLQGLDAGSSLCVPERRMQHAAGAVCSLWRTASPPPLVGSVNVRGAQCAAQVQYDKTCVAASVADTQLHLLQHTHSFAETVDEVVGSGGRTRR